MSGVELIVDDPAWRSSLNNASRLVARCFASARALEPRLAGSIALLLTSDERVAELNERFRGKRGATNVLAFPSGGSSDEFLGDIALAHDLCLAEAVAKDISMERHAAHLIIHGLLHLVGYDHDTEPAAVAMESLETKILGELGVPDPHVGQGASN